MGTVPLINGTFKKNHDLFIQQNKTVLFLPFMPANIAKAYRTEKLGYFLIIIFENNKKVNH